MLGTKYMDLDTKTIGCLCPSIDVIHRLLATRGGSLSKSEAYGIIRTESRETEEHYTRERERERTLMPSTRIIICDWIPPPQFTLILNLIDFTLVGPSAPRTQLALHSS
jgi:hypothetical protein